MNEEIKQELVDDVKEVGVGQRELSIESDASFSPEERELIVNTVEPLVWDIVKASGSQTLIAALGELVQNANAGLKASAKASEVSEASEESKLMSEQLNQP